VSRFFCVAVEKLPYMHGRPLRLRNELQHGYQLVKWIKGTS